MSEPRSRLGLLTRLLSVVVGSMLGAHAYGSGYGTALALGVALLAAAASLWLLSSLARRTPKPDRDTSDEPDLKLPMRQEARRRQRNRRVLLRRDADDPPRT